MAVANQVVDIIEKNYDIKLLGVNCLTKFFKDSKNKNYGASTKYAEFAPEMRLHWYVLVTQT